MSQPPPEVFQLPPKRVSGPSMLDLVRLSREVVFPPGGQALFRRIATLVEMHEGMEVLDAACGRGVSTSFLAQNYGCACVGVDPDQSLVSEAERRARDADLQGRLSFDTAALDDLPFRDGIFDVAIGELGLAGSADPARAVSELARVTKPMGVVCLLQLTWSSEITSGARELLVERLGLRPHLLVEWKQMLRDAGVVEIQVQDWTSGGPASTGRNTGSARAIAEPPQLTWQQKAQILGRTWRRWGWRAGALRAGRGAVEREAALLRELSRERAIGFQLIKGVKWPHAKGA